MEQVVKSCYYVYVSVCVYNIYIGIMYIIYNICLGDPITSNRGVTA